MTDIDLAELTRSVRKLQDRLEIEALVSGYTVMLDDRHWDTYEDFFTDDAQFEYGWMSQTGKDGMNELVAEHLEECVYSQHLIANLTITFDDSGDEASGRANYFVTVVMPDHQQGGPYWHEGGYYLHKYRRTPDGWKFSHLETCGKWVVGGEFSRDHVESIH
jgi:3-phenylpropionate/cinnamic acid dioxygenase small subunit